MSGPDSLLCFSVVVAFSLCISFIHSSLFALYLCKESHANVFFHYFEKYTQQEAKLSLG